MRGAWKVVVVRPDGSELRLLVVAEGMTDASDGATWMLKAFGIETKGLRFGAVERLY